MTLREFQVLTAVEDLARGGRTLPTPSTAMDIRAYLLDNFHETIEPSAVCDALDAMRLRRLVVTKPGLPSIRWLPTLYGSKVVSA